MLGQPEPIFPERSSEAIVSRSRSEFSRDGFVSLWAGTFASVEDAEAYFGIPNEIGVNLPAEAFATDFGLGDFQPEILEVNFEQPSPRSLTELLEDATFAASFGDLAVEAAQRQGIREAQGVALLYDFDYRLKPVRPGAAGPLRFISGFPFIRALPRAQLQPYLELADVLGYSAGSVLFVTTAFAELCKKRHQDQGGQSEHVTTREFCEYLLNCRGEDSTPTLRECGLLRSEQIGRVVIGLVNAGLARRQASDSEADFRGLFSLE